MMLAQINRVISSAISERVIPEIRNIVSSMFSSGSRDTEANSSSNCPENREETIGIKKLKRDSRSAYDLRNTEDIGPYNNCVIF